MLSLPRFPSILAIGLAALPAQADEVSVFAAASMKTALDAFAAEWSASSGHHVTLSYAGSNTLAKQIIEGAPTDIFISAASDWMDEVEKAGLIDDGARRDLWGNQLVLIAHGAGAPAVTLAPDLDLAGLLDGEFLAMGQVASVPAGQYGKAALEHLGLWQQIETQVAQTDNVRAALALVSSGETPFGIVYASDAAADPGVSIVATFPETSHPPILYPVALLTEAKDAADRAFFEALASPEAAAIFTQQGFSVLSKP